MNEQPLVSIGVPVAKCVYLREALACWTKQTYKNFEVLLSDDAAPGDVRGAVEPYLGDARFTYVRQEVNSAPHFTRNWNACLERAKGKYFVLASDDDLYAPNFLERMVCAPLWRNGGIGKVPSLSSITAMPWGCRLLRRRCWSEPKPCER